MKHQAEVIGTLTSLTGNYVKDNDHCVSLDYAQLFKPEVVEKDKKIVHLYTGSRNLTSELEQLKRSKELKHLEYQITKKKATLKKATSHYKTENVFRRDKSCQIRMRK